MKPEVKFYAINNPLILGNPIFRCIFKLYQQKEIYCDNTNFNLLIRLNVEEKSGGKEPMAAKNNIIYIQFESIHQSEFANFQNTIYFSI